VKKDERGAANNVRVSVAKFVQCCQPQSTVG